MPWQLIVVAAVGASLGSFLNVVSLRLKHLHANLTGRSQCPQCRETLRWWELVPIISFFLLRGRCRTCRLPLAWQYPFVEIVGALVWVAAFTAAPLSLRGYALAAITAMIATLIILLWIIDLKYFLLPDVYLLLLSIAIVLKLWAEGTPQPTSSLGGALLGTGVLLLIWAVTAGRGLGFGDVKLALPLGLLFGVSGISALLFLAFMSGGLMAALLLLTKRATLKTAVPFGPYLLAAALVLLLDPHLGSRIFAYVLG